MKRLDFWTWIEKRSAAVDYWPAWKQVLLVKQPLKNLSAGKKSEHSKNKT